MTAHGGGGKERGVCRLDLGGLEEGAAVAAARGAGAVVHNQEETDALARAQGLGAAVAMQRRGEGDVAGAAVGQDYPHAVRPGRRLHHHPLQPLPHPLRHPIRLPEEPRCALASGRCPPGGRGERRGGSRAGCRLRLLRRRRWRVWRRRRRLGLRRRLRQKGRWWRRRRGCADCGRLVCWDRSPWRGGQEQVWRGVRRRWHRR